MGQSFIDEKKQKRRKNQNKICIDLISKAYNHARSRLHEVEYGHYSYPDYIVEDCEKIVYHIDSVIDMMDEKSKLILINEIKDRKTGEWYRDYCSTTTYYRIRDRIYDEFLKEINK